MGRIEGFFNLRAATSLIVAAIAIASTSAQAVVTPFSSYMTFENAASGLTTYDFGLVPLPPFGSGAVTPANSGVSFSSDNSFVSPRGDFSPIPPTDIIVYTGLSTTVSEATPSTVTVGLAGATAIGFYFGAYDFFGTPLAIKVTSNSTGATFDSVTSTFSVTLPANNNPYLFSFIGFTSPSDITQVVFTQPDPNNGLHILTFSVGSIAAIPEPSIPALFVLGLALIGTIVRRKSR